MTPAATSKPAALYPTRSAAGALLGQQLAARGYLGCLLLGITPEGVEIAANAAKAQGGQKALLTKVAASDLVFLRAAEYARLRNYADVSGRKQQQYLSIFQPIIGS